MLLHHFEIGMSSTSFNENLIAEVKTRPSLYNKAHSEYYDKPKRKKVWLEIAAALVHFGKPVDEEFCRKRWRSLRDQYNRERRMGLTSDSEEETNATAWPLSSALSFLDPHIKKQSNELPNMFVSNSLETPRGPYVMPIMTPEPGHTSEYDHSFLEIKEIKEELCDQQTESAIAEETLPKRLKLRPQNDVKESILKLNAKESQEMDSDDLFMAFIANEMRRVKCPMRKQLLRIEIMKLVGQATQESI